MVQIKLPYVWVNGTNIVLFSCFLLYDTNFVLGPVSSINLSCSYVLGTIMSFGQVNGVNFILWLMSDGTL